jgi:kynurenine formamidase
MTVAATLRAVDLSHPLDSHMAGWRGKERARIEVEEVVMEHGVPDIVIAATRIAMVCHAGTHIDAARHFYADGRTIDQYPTTRFVCRAWAVDIPREAGHEVSADELRALDPGVEPGDALFLHFGFADRYTTPEYHDHPFLGADATDYLVERGIGMLGVDLVTPDAPPVRRTPDFDFPVHTRLLSRDILIMENVGPGVKDVLGRSFLLVTPPLRIEDGDASPVAPVALIDEDGLG